MTPEAAAENLFQCLEELDLDSPFDMFDAFLQNMAVGDAEVQVALCDTMFGAENPLIRETAAVITSYSIHYTKLYELFEDASAINHATADDPPLYLYYPQANEPLPASHSVRDA